MSVRIRLKRIGKRQQAFYRIVVSDQRVKRDGRVIDDLGFYQPWIKDKKAQLDRNQYQTWVKKGAVPTVTVRKLFQNLGKAVKEEAHG